MCSPAEIRGKPIGLGFWLGDFDVTGTQTVDSSDLVQLLENRIP